MRATRAPEQDRTPVLRRQPARIVNGEPEGGYTDAYEIICRDCGDDPGHDYHDIPPRLQHIRGPYWLTAGAAQYEAHIEWHEEQQLAKARLAPAVAYPRRAAPPCHFAARAHWWAGCVTGRWARRSFPGRPAGC